MDVGPVGFEPMTYEKQGTQLYWVHLVDFRLLYPKKGPSRPSECICEETLPPYVTVSGGVRCARPRTSRKITKNNWSFFSSLLLHPLYARIGSESAIDRDNNSCYKSRSRRNQPKRGTQQILGASEAVHRRMRQNGLTALR
jgi:hypothetical protein